MHLGLREFKSPSDTSKWEPSHSLTGNSDGDPGQFPFLKGEKGPDERPICEVTGHVSRHATPPTSYSTRARRPSRPAAPPRRRPPVGGPCSRRTPGASAWWLGLR